ncbi:tripartite motif-containing protein 59 [Hyperolius riggenbachi]|uniref:tripartite motif-containing protein 59 n=1 Tax=Hyperolius riggenbachi TaxID=752182 RepID=UPI0035A2E984
MEHLKEDLACPVCFNIYEDPRLLKCSHTFCRSCLENILRSSDSYLWRLSGGRLKCPSCRDITDTSAGVGSLPINFALKSIVDKYKSTNSFFLRTCSDHNGKQLTLFCLKCRKVICAHCKEIGQHRHHSISDLEHAFRKERKTASKLLPILQDENFTGVSTVIRALEEQLEECKAIIQEDKKEVVTFFDEIIEMFEDKKQNLLAALNDLDQKIDTAYAPRIEAMKRIQDEELDLITLASSTQDEESPLVYLENIHAIERGMEALKKQQLCPAQPVKMYPRIGPILNQWLKTSIGDAPKKPIPKFGFNHKARPPKISFMQVSFAVLLCVTSLFYLVYPDTVFRYTSWCWNLLSKTVEPVFSCFGTQLFVNKSSTQRLKELVLEFVSYLYSLPSQYFS